MSDYLFRHYTNLYLRGPRRGHKGEYLFQMVRSEPEEIAMGRQWGETRMWQTYQLAKHTGWRLTISDETVADSQIQGFPIRKGWMGFKFTLIYVYEEPGKISEGWLGGTPDKNNPTTMVGLVKPSKKQVEIESDQLRVVGLAAYEFWFKPLLAYAMQFPPFVAD